MGAIRKLTQNFVETEVDGEVLLVDLDGGELFSLAGTARDVWRAIDGESNPAAIAAQLAQAFDSDASAIEQDIREFLQDLERARLIDAAL